MPDFKKLWDVVAGKILGQLKPSTPVMAEVKCPKAPAAARPTSSKSSRYLVIYLTQVEFTCACCNKPKQVNAIFARPFDCVTVAETFRTSVKRQTGGDARLVTGAGVCSEYRRLAAAIPTLGPEPVIKFLSDQFERASSPALN